MIERMIITEEDDGFGAQGHHEYNLGWLGLQEHMLSLSYG